MKHALYNVSERTPNRMVLGKRPYRSIYELALGAGMFGLILYTMLELNHGNETIWQRINLVCRQPFNLFYLLFIIPLGIGILKSIFALVTGDRIYLNKGEGTVSKTTGKLFRITEIDCLQIRKYVDSENSVDYRLSIVKQDGEKMFIDRSSDRDGIIEFAEEIADFLDKPIRYKGTE